VRHRHVESAERNITLVPRELAADMKRAVQKWFTDLRSSANVATLTTVKGNLRFLMREQPKVLPGLGGPQFMVHSST
jgi:hypothetical protein